MPSPFSLPLVAMSPRRAPTNGLIVASVKSQESQRESAFQSVILSLPATAPPISNCESELTACSQLMAVRSAPVSSCTLSSARVMMAFVRSEEFDATFLESSALIACISYTSIMSKESSSYLVPVHVLNHLSGAVRSPT